MPRKPKRPCSFPGCPKLTEGRFCEEHAKAEARRYEKYQRDPEARKTLRQSMDCHQKGLPCRASSLRGLPCGRKIHSGRGRPPHKTAVSGRNPWHQQPEIGLQGLSCQDSRRAGRPLEPQSKGLRPQKVMKIPLLPPRGGQNMQKPCQKPSGPCLHAQNRNFKEGYSPGPAALSPRNLGIRPGF